MRGEGPSKICRLLTAVPLLQIIHAIAVARSRPAWPETAPKPLVVSHNSQPAAAVASLSGPQRLGSCSMGNMVVVMALVMLGRDAASMLSKHFLPADAPSSAALQACHPTATT